MKFRFPIVIIDEDFHAENSSGFGIRALKQAIELESFEVQGFTRYADITGFAQQQSRAAAFILSIDDDDFQNAEGTAEGRQEGETLRQIRNFMREIRQRNPDLPIFLYGETRTSRHLPNDVLRELHGFIHLFEDTPEFVARGIAREARLYLKSLPPPFFRALLEYAQDASYSWHCPGHSGGVAFLKSPVGQMFHQFFGENLLRSDVCNSVGALGQLLDHLGPVQASERNAARIFGADHCFFVTNGTSTSNKIVWHATVASGDIVLVDRNCHKSILHAIIMCDAIPVFLPPTRNHHGIIGPIPREAFTPQAIGQRIAANPLARAALAKNPELKPRILTLTQSTYDGILYHVPEIKAALADTVPTLLFDEAWLPHAAFHPFYRGMHAIDREQPRDENVTTFATQSTHKLLAGLSQASQILVQEPTRKPLDTMRFNEAYLMHTSTSPQYAIIASCDVAAAMMEYPAGEALAREAISEALDFRRAMRKAGEEYANGGESSPPPANIREPHAALPQGAAPTCAATTPLPGRGWWFRLWEPEQLPAEGIGTREDWLLSPEAHWHGFGRLSPGFNMLDPIKATVLTPGLEIDGRFGEWGIPAALVSKYLAEYGIVVEKTGLYFFFLLFNIGITKGRWNTLVTELEQFKDAFDHNAPLWRLLPHFVAEHPRYERMGIRDLAQQIHLFYRAHDVARLTTQMYLSEMIPAMRPSTAFSHIAHGQVERVALDVLEGRITSTLLTPYPPGIPLLIPGERFNRVIVDYLRFAREFNARFPGFEADIHGLVNEGGGYFVDCVIETGYV